MSQNILITGAAGYIGGSLVADLLSSPSDQIKRANIYAAVRSKEQAESLARPGITVIQLDLSDEKAVHEAVLRNEINIILHTASSHDARVIYSLITALGQRRKISGEETYYVHTSVATVFSEEAGWPYGEVKDTDTVLEKERQIGGQHAVRLAHIQINELAKAEGVTSYIVPVPTIYGRGSGAWRKLSVSIPAFVRASIEHKIVYKFDKDGNPPATHISDLTALYVLLVEKILQKEPIPSGEKGYYFATAHKISWWEIMQRLAEGLHTRGLVAEPKTQIWPSDEMAAEALGFPPLYVRAMGTSSGDLVPVNPYKLGWKPQWDEKRFLESMDDEIQAVQELDTVKPTIFGSLGVKSEK